jgi:hypothetical protein
MSVLPGSASVGRRVGETNVGCNTVGICSITVAGGGVATSMGRARMLTSPKLYRHPVTIKTIPAQPAAHCRRGDSVLYQFRKRIIFTPCKNGYGERDYMGDRTKRQSCI